MDRPVTDKSAEREAGEDIKEQGRSNTRKEKVKKEKVRTIL